MFWRDLDERVCALLAGAKTSVVIVAPFIKAATLRHLFEVIPHHVPASVFTRWRVDEVAAGVSDPKIVDLAESRDRTQVWLCDVLHAKLYMVDGTRALLGSANVTAAGLGLARRPNLELLHAAEPPVATGALFVAELRALSRPATRTEAEAVMAAADELNAKTLTDSASPSDAQDASADVARNWFPQFRSPDRLYSLANDHEWILGAAVGDAALVDLLALGIDASKGEAAFDDAVRERLRGAPVVIALDRLLAEPQRFGALTEWLRSHLPEASREERQAAGQTLIRWLTYFEPERYAVEVPGVYSEVLSLRLAV